MVQRRTNSEKVGRNKVRREIKWAFTKDRTDCLSNQTNQRGGRILKTMSLV